MNIDLNADLGEDTNADDAALMQAITSANIACGVHAGNAAVMDRTVALAVARGVAIGAHPSFPDREGFGRARMQLPSDEVRAWVAYQVGALAAVAGRRGARLTHVKPHGAMYNMASVDRELADAIAQAVHAFDRTLVLVGLPASALTDAGRRAGLETAAEGFADRGYRSDGSLVPRSEPGAVLTDPARVTERAVMLAVEGKVQAVDGSYMSLDVDTICIHGDTPGAALLAARVRAALERAGISVQALHR
jgi:5-oxoprolinase (ATP-hydrolysing) subunit A